MSNFTKSILYSTTVLAAGLVAIFVIYDGFTKEQASQVAAVEPAAGESDFGIQYDAEANTITPSSGETAAEDTPVTATTEVEAPAAAETEAVATEEVAPEEPAIPAEDGEATIEPAAEGEEAAAPAPEAVIAEEAPETEEAPE